jgi:hypothetical protein
LDLGNNICRNLLKLVIAVPSPASLTQYTMLYIGQRVRNFKFKSIPGDFALQKKRSSHFDLVCHNFFIFDLSPFHSQLTKAAADVATRGIINALVTP